LRRDKYIKYLFVLCAIQAKSAGSGLRARRRIVTFEVIVAFQGRQGEDMRRAQKLLAECWTVSSSVVASLHLNPDQRRHFFRPRALPPAEAR
jgi:hypothetical protein